MKAPEEWVDYIFRRRKAAVEGMLSGRLKGGDFLVEFTRTAPAVVTCGPAGLNASVKMVGIMPKSEHIQELLGRIRSLSARNPSVREVAEFLLREVYVEEKLDFLKLFTLDLARKRTWANIRERPEAVLIFFTPPATSYMVVADVEVHEGDEVAEFANAMHDIFHSVPFGGSPGRHPAYVFRIKEIWDKSADKFGVRIFP